MDILNIIALCILFSLFIFLVYAVIYIHDIPYEIAKKRNHPHQDALQAAGWVSLFLMHSIWPFLWVWAYYYPNQDKKEDVDSKLKNLKEEIEQLKIQIKNS